MGDGYLIGRVKMQDLKNLVDKAKKQCQKFGKCDIACYKLFSRA